MTQVVNAWDDGVSFTGATTNIPAFTILGGKYFYAISAAGTSSELDLLMPDGSTYQAVGTSTTQTTSAATAVVDLPPGTYRIQITTVSAVIGALIKVPYARH